MEIARIKDQVSIEDLLIHYGWSPDDNGWGGWSGWTPTMCPFHDDRNPSASVNVEKGRFNCHGCGVSGDIFDIVQTTEGLDFKEAGKWIAETFLV